MFKKYLNKLNNLPCINYKIKKNKIYMLYKSNKFHKQIINIDDYELVRYEKYPERFRYSAYSASGKEINILLR
jgi:hypothetical protein